MNSDKKEEKIFELAEQFVFEELSTKDKNFILSIMTESEYNEFRSTINNLPACFDNDIEVETMAPQLPIRTKRKIIMEIINYKIPLYKVAVGMIFAFFIFSSVNHFKLNKAFDNKNIFAFESKNSSSSNDLTQTDQIEKVMLMTNKNSLANDTVTKQILAILTP